MSESARKFEQEPEAAEKAPESGERPVEGEKTPLERLIAMKMAAARDINHASSLGIKYAREKAEPEIVLGLQQDEQDALAKLDALSMTSEKAFARFISPLDVAPPSHIVQLEPEDDASKFQSVDVPLPTYEPPIVTMVERTAGSEHIAQPQDETEFRAMQSSFAAKHKELAELNKIPATKRTEKDDVMRGMLASEVAILKKNLERYDLEFDTRIKKDRLAELDEKTAAILRRAKPANDVDLKQLSPKERVILIESLPVEDKTKIEEIQKEQHKLESALSKNRTKIAEIVAAMVGLDRLLMQNRSHLGSIEIHEAEAAEVIEEQRVLKEVEEKRRQAEQAEKEKPNDAAIAMKTVGKVSVAGAGLIIAGGFAAVAGIFGGFRRAMGWIDGGLQKIFGPSWVDKFLVPPKEEKKEKKKSE